jgi:hypothetical protein
MQLTRELLLTYPGLDGLCHLRVYEQAGQEPIAIGGDEGERLRSPLAENANRAGEQPQD